MLMSEKNKKLIYLIYGIVQSVLLVLCGVCLMIACLSIYDGGEGTFSRGAVAVQFKRFMIPIILCVTGLVAGMVLSLILPREPQRIKGEHDVKATISRLSSRVDKEKCPSKITELIKREQNLRWGLKLLATAICIVVAIPCLAYLLNLSNFDDIGEGLTEDILGTMAFVLPAAIEGLAAWTVVVFACRASFNRELILIKGAIKVAPMQRKAKAEIAVKDNQKRKMWIIRGAVLLVALVFIIVGIFNGGMKDVLEKAIRICTECIGLG